jgi:hypothetical protein
LAGYHPYPGDQFHRYGEEVVVDVVDYEEVSEAERDDAEGGDEETPEVTASIAFEGGEAQDDQLQCIIPRDSDEARDYGILRYPACGVGAGLRGFSSQAEIARDVDARHEDIAECGRYGYSENMRRGGILSIYRYSGGNEELRHNKRERGWEIGEKAQEVAENMGDKP